MATHQAGAPGASPQATPEKLPGIRHIVAIGSGKGGVGKSTVSVNLALVLQRLGGRIGLVDADVLVPSIPACSALADFQRTTRGTATQTIKALVASGHLRTQRSKSDGRSVQLQLTARGRKIVAHDPFEVLVRAIAALDSQRRAGLYTGLQQVLAAVDGDGAHRRFGVCRDCAYIGGDVCCNLKGIRAPALECLLLGVPMPPEEAELLCVKFRPKFAPT